MAGTERVWVAADGSWGSFVPGELWVVDDVESLEDMTEEEIVAFAREQGRPVADPSEPVAVVAYVSPDAMCETEDVQAVGAGAGDIEWSATADGGADAVVTLRLAPGDVDDDGEAEG